VSREPSVELGCESSVGADFGEVVGSNAKQARGLIDHGQLVLTGHGHE
jgi:hypothetical protein